MCKIDVVVYKLWHKLLTWKFDMLRHEMKKLNSVFLIYYMSYEVDVNFQFIIIKIVEDIKKVVKN